jgi:hypothetical protein
MEQVSHKRCTKCSEVKPLSEFYAHKNTADRLTTYCKTCVRAQVSARRQELRKDIPPRELSPTYVAMHLYLLAHFPKSRICEECGKPASRTEFALIHGRPYSRNREDYRELCHPCHNRYDHGGERCYAAKLTWAQVTEIRRRYEPGSTSNGRMALAAEFGVHTNTIWNITSGRKWAAP